MVDAAAVRRLAAALPEMVDGSDDRRLVFEVGGKGFAWSFNERVHPKKPRVPRLDILAVRCAMEAKEMLIAAAPDRFFDDDHYKGFAAVLVRLDVVDEDELEGLLREAWRIRAPKALLKRLGM
ncbi:MAG: hypothetical protein JWP49_2281 [Phenylobacterium sp.]|jgi:hypothetical protein|nr:hypothetical protein [Phenylobacterium sp.]